MSTGFFGLRKLFGYTSQSGAHKGRKVGRRLGVESLENRALLAADCLGAFTGTVGLDADSNGVIDVGEEVAGATIQVWEDTDGNGVFDPAIDTLAGTDTTDASGDYLIDGLESGDYFVVQPQQTVGANALDESVSPLKTANGSGVPGTLIDNFSDDSPVATDVHPPDGASTSVFHSTANAIGGERDLEAEITSGMSGDEVELRAATGMLLINPDFFSQGIYNVSWDGTDSLAALDPVGLGGIDLTSGSSALGGIGLTDVSFDQAGAQLTLRVYSDATNFSEAVISGIAPFTSNDFFVSFDPAAAAPVFTAVGGAGADFTNVGAIELEVLSTSQAMDGAIDMISVINPDVTDCDFVNTAPVPNIDIEKATNGIDADITDAADVPVVGSGSTVTWTYVVTNTGQTPINNVAVTDDAGTPGVPGDDFTPTFSGGDTNGNNVLDLNETWTYSATGTAIDGTYTNKATVNGVSTTGIDVMDMDNSNYVGIAPSIDIEKLTNGFQADNAGDADVPTIQAGETVTWTYIVTNNGTDPLTNVTVTDNQIGAISNIISRSINSDNTLDPNEVWTYTATGTAIDGNYVNIADVVGTGSDGTTVVDDADASRYVGFQNNPAIDIEKATNGSDADVTGTGPVVPVGQAVTFTFVVTNVGDVPLRNVAVIDDNGTPADTSDDIVPTFTGGDTNSDGQLDLTEVWTYTATRDATLGLHVNDAKVTGEDDQGEMVMASDPSNHTGFVPDVLSKRRFLASAAS